MIEGAAVTVVLDFVISSVFVARNGFGNGGNRQCQKVYDSFNERRELGKRIKPGQWEEEGLNAGTHQAAREQRLLVSDR